MWVSPTTSPVRLGVSPAVASTHRGVFNQRFEALFPVLEPWVARSVLLPCRSSRFICVRMWGRRVCQMSHCLPCSTICHFAGSSRNVRPLCPGCPSLPLLPVWMNVSSLSPWLSEFHAVGFSVSSGCFLFLNCCCPSLVVRGGTMCLPMPPSWLEAKSLDILKKDFIYFYLREWGREGERDEEKHRCVRKHQSSCFSYLRLFTLWDDAQPTEPQQSGLVVPLFVHCQNNELGP